MFSCKQDIKINEWKKNNTTGETQFDCAPPLTLLKYEIPLSLNFKAGNHVIEFRPYIKMKCDVYSWGLNI